jgi:hypothetical protein
MQLCSTFNGDVFMQQSHNLAAAAKALVAA